MDDFDARLDSVQLEPPAGVDRGSGLSLATRHGDLLFVSGHGPFDADGRQLYRGRIGADLSPEDGYLAARATGLALLRTVRQHLGSLNRVDRIVRAFALVNSAPDFHDQPTVLHGFSDLMVEIFGPERGPHARSAMGTSTLPHNIPVEIEMAVAIRD